MTEIDYTKLEESAGDEIKREVEINDIIEELGPKITQEQLNNIQKLLNEANSTEALSYIKEIKNTSV